MNDSFPKRRRFTLEDTDWSGQVMGFGTSMSGDPCFVGGTCLRPLLRVANLKSENQPCLTIAASMSSRQLKRSKFFSATWHEEPIP